jgi:hypothetical protein
MLLVTLLAAALAQPRAQMVDAIRWNAYDIGRRTRVAGARR